jgi:HEAT repeat protein
MSKLLLCVSFLCLFLSFEAQAQTVNSANLLKQLLDLPAPRGNSEETSPVKTERKAEFFSYERIPPDDAPIEDLIDYWSMQSSYVEQLQYNLKPSEKTLERLLDYYEEKPGEIAVILPLMPTNPDIAERIKKIHDRLAQTEDENNYALGQVNHWLQFNSKYYLDKLVKAAQRIRNDEDYLAGGGQEILRALAKVDWESAKPIIERLENDSTQPFSSTTAKWVSYEHALATGDTATAERYRGELRKIVENKKAPVGLRDMAMDSLVLSGDWEGRDDWYYSLLEDETLLELQDKGFTGLTTLITMSPREKFVGQMIKLTQSPDFAVRSAAVRNLTALFEDGGKDILEALLPWLSNPDWARASDKDERIKLISALGEIDLPEAVPGLIWVVQNEKGGNRGAAASSLVRYKDSSAIPALRFALLDEKIPGYRQHVIKALIACGGIGEDEQMSSLELYAAFRGTPEGFEQIQNYEYIAYDEETDGAKTKPLPLPVVIGKFVAEQEEPSDGLAARAVERLKALRKTKPDLAKILAEIMQKWKGRVIYLEAFRRIKAGEADVDTILDLLANRKNVRVKIPNEIVSLRVSNDTARGVGACVAEDAGEFTSILSQEDAETQVAMLSCARLVRAALPLAEVGGFLKSANKTLALAAERYLESEDSVQARTLVLANHPNEALILGAQQAFIPADVKNVYTSPSLDALFMSVTNANFAAANLSEIKKSEESLRAEIKENAEMLAIYAFLPELRVGQYIVRVYKNRIVFNYYENGARFREKDLTAEEYEKFYQWLVENKIDASRGATTQYCERCFASEFVMFGRNGGRRVFFLTNSYDLSPVENIEKLFAPLRESKLNLHYRLSDKIKNLEILFAQDKLNALAVWKKDGDFRVLFEDEVKEEEIKKYLAQADKADAATIADRDDDAALEARVQRRRNRVKEVSNAQFSWRKMESGKPGAVVSQPSEMPYLTDEAQFPTAEETSRSFRAWQTRAGNFEIQTGTYGSDLYKVSRSQSPVKIKDGTYSSPLVTPDGKWVVVSNSQSSWTNAPGELSRINMETGKEFKINLPPANVFVPIAYVASRDKVLLFRAGGRLYVMNTVSFYADFEAVDAKNPSPKVPEYYLLDVNTGATEPVKGEFSPLEHQSYRPLQPTASAGEFWAGVYH